MRSRSCGDGGVGEGEGGADGNSGGTDGVGVDGALRSVYFPVLMWSVEITGAEGGGVWDL